ncbi:SDR family oxidoreductase [Amycolatopsis orientalis]|uniref:SDR family oxidoreductase n=1 Tax=Amycolatopsis orientalis TaxID=31958 RepID=UPI0003A925EA|nr:SDR family oxidoreductase [Amycolatopsis orientalis]
MGMLDGKVALVTGGANGIGRAVVESYLDEGARVAVLDRDADGLARLEAGLGGDELLTVAGSVELLADNQRAVAATTERFGRLDVFVGNAGVGAGNLLLSEIPLERLESAVDEMFDINVKAYLLGARAALGPLLRSDGPAMVFSCSIASFRAVDDGVLYVSSKHADAGIVRGLAWELAPRIRVNGVAIGVARTRMEGLRSLGQQPIDAVLPGAEQVIPLGFVPEPRDYGAGFVYLASDRARVVTGECLWADSGFGIRGIGAPSGGSRLDVDRIGREG